MPLMIDAIYFTVNYKVSIITPPHFIYEQIELQEDYAKCDLVRVKTGLDSLSA
jgi:hypothetical protein